MLHAEGVDIRWVNGLDLYFSLYSKYENFLFSVQYGYFGIFMVLRLYKETSLPIIEPPRTSYEPYKPCIN